MTIGVGAIVTTDGSIRIATTGAGVTRIAMTDPAIGASTITIARCATATATIAARVLAPTTSTIAKAINPILPARVLQLCAAELWRAGWRRPGEPDPRARQRADSLPAGGSKRQ